MLKRIVAAAVLLGMLSCQESKIGYVDQVRLMKDLQERMDIESEFQAENSAFIQQRDSITQAFQAEAESLQEKTSRMSQSRAQEEMGAFQQRAQAVGQQLQQVEQRLRSQGQARMDSVISKVREEISNYGEANGYGFILTGGDGGSVIYGKEGTDLTDEILEKLNASYKAE